MSNFPSTVHVPASRLITHSGSFHADEVLAYVILRSLYPDAELVRTRELEVLGSPLPTDILFDVGKRLDAQTFDHHQGGVARTNGVPYAAAGLVWKEFGREWVARRLPECPDDMVERLLVAVDASLIEGIDAMDNAAVSRGTHLLRKNQCEPGTRKILLLDLTSIIATFRPQGYVDFEGDAPEDMVTAAFLEAAAVTEAIFVRMVRRSLSILLTQRQLPVWHRWSVENIDPTGAVLLMPSFVQFAEYARHHRNLIAVTYPSGGQWMTRTVDSHTGCKGLFPVEMRGAEPSKLAELSGVADMMFCHPAGWLAASGSKESALQLARLLVDEARRSELELSDLEVGDEDEGGV